ncbi:molybdenum cofactor guanylyltransferase [Haladaptatus sp. NG-SE-30]
MTDERVGVVLAGGYATRFDGGDKALAELDGRPLLEHVVERLDRVVDRLVVNCRADQVASFTDALTGRTEEYSLAIDPVPDLGPTAGIAAGTRDVRSEYVAVVACDNPLVSPELLDHLFERAVGHDAAIPRGRGGWLKPTQAVYRTARLASACRTALREENYRLLSVVEPLDSVVVPVEKFPENVGSATFTDVNTVDDLRRLEEGIESSGELETVRK